MQNLIIVFLIIIIGILFTLYVFLKKEIKNTTNQLKRINKIDTNSKIQLSSTDKILQELVTEINRTLVEKQEMKSEYKKVDLELKQAIANMSHDLRTPLTSIMGYIQLIEDDNLSDDDKKRYVDIIKRRAKSLEILISSFYEFSRLEGKEYQFQLKSIKLPIVTSDIIASFYNDFIEKGIEPIIEIDNNLESTIADEKAVRRIISNLIQNMIKYGNSFVKIELKQKDNYILMSFENDAEDLEKDHISRLFDRFFTANKTRSDNSSGLGLAITKQLVEQMGHSISAELNEGNLKIIIKWKTL
ncbi:HAMP domain-containing histidine kinase [Clostridium sp. D2Q-11]|uniref:histidine kinase n=1 Tax=Anaeromonas frigoriresistens TaxID=2683708 RepID=A0A942UWC7_9FIRM|nr:HAMP domain-containing sensor histidine kinase [Anaeromonas frigoriresistens]MBS4538750.1 HAMP domain-containing histidine kinase [Anaeromonas frigoriresistens]